MEQIAKLNRSNTMVRVADIVNIYDSQIQTPLAVFTFEIRIASGF